MNTKRPLLILSVMGMTLSGAITAAPIEPPKSAPVAAKELPEKDIKTIALLAREFSFKEKDLQALREKDWAWEEISNALVIAERAEKPLSTVVALRNDGKNWKEIAEVYGFKTTSLQGRFDNAVIITDGVDKVPNADLKASEPSKVPHYRADPDRAPGKWHGEKY